MTNVPRKLVGALLVLHGAFFVVTFQGWGRMLMRQIGFERALGADAVRHVGDGRVLLTNPLGMFLWSLPILVLGIVLVIVGVRIWRDGRSATSGL